MRGRAIIEFDDDDGRVSFYHRVMREDDIANLLSVLQKCNPDPATVLDPHSRVQVVSKDEL